MMRYFLIALVITVMDQLTKKLVLATLSHGDVMRVFSWFDLVHIHNRGAAFSMLAGAEWANGFLLTVGILTMVLLCLWLGLGGAKESWQNKLALALILGGAGGNVADRLQFGYVVDFISVHYKNLYYPSFNVADSAVSLGVLFILLGLLSAKEKNKSERHPAPESVDRKNKT